MNHNHSHDEQMVEQIDKAIDSGAAPGSPIVEALIAATPAANPRFERQLEARLLAHLQTKPAGRSAARKRLRVPLTLAVAMLLLVIAGGLLLMRGIIPNTASQYAAQPLQADLQQTQVALESTQTALVALATQQAAEIKAYQNQLMQLAHDNFEVGGVVTAVDSEPALDAVQRSGMTWIKLEIAYPKTFAEVEASINQAHENGLRLLVTAVGDPARLDDSQYVEDFVSWLADLAAAGVDGIQVWREPNINRLWPSSKLAGENYVELLRQAYRAIKEAAPQTLVISAAPAPTGAEAAFPDQVLNDEHWLRQVVDSDGLQYLDCVGVQYNEGVLPPDALGGDPRDNYYTRFLGGMYAAYTQIIGPQKPLCFTELGYLSPEGYPALPTFFAWANETTIANQAEWLGKAIELLHKVGQVRLMIIWNVDFTAYGNDPQAGYAMIRDDGSCPACEQVRAVMDRLDNASEALASLSAPTPAAALDALGVQPVIVALQDVPQGTRLTEDLLALVYWPVENLPESAYSDLEALIDTYTAVDVSRWQPLLTGQITPDNIPLAQQFVGRLPAGKVAFAIPMTRLNTVSALLQAGDQVNILATMLVVDAADPTATPKLQTQTILSERDQRQAEILEIGGGSLVLAVDQSDAEILTWLVESQIPLTFVQVGS